jgi:hypothetical protein
LAVVCFISLTFIDNIQLNAVLLTDLSEQYAVADAARDTAYELIAQARAGGDMTLLATAEAALAAAEAEFAAEMESAKRSEDASFVKRIEGRKNDAASGAYIRERRSFIAAITTFCSQVFLIANGVAVADLPNGELFDHLAVPVDVKPERAARILKEAEDLDYTLRFNVNDELALRTFAVNIAMDMQ